MEFRSLGSDPDPTTHYSWDFEQTFVKSQFSHPQTDIIMNVFPDICSSSGMAVPPGVTVRS